MRARRFVCATVVGALTGCLSPAISLAGTQEFPSVPLGQTPQYREWQVPAGVTSATFDLYGAQGQGDNGAGGAGGFGAHVRRTLDVTPGETLRVYPGGTPGNGSGSATAQNGGGGTDVRRAPYGNGTQNSADDRLLVAGGGGGAGIAAVNGQIVTWTRGGDAGSTGSSAAGGGGGAGGANSGGAAGSAPAGVNCIPAGAGGLFQGGYGGGGFNACQYGSAGGGGGGLYGGGGGGAGPPADGGGGGGGGGSSTPSTVIDVLHTGNGRGTVTYTDPPVVQQPGEQPAQQPAQSQQPSSAPATSSSQPPPEQPAIAGSTSVGNTTVSSTGAFTLAKRVADCGGSGPSCVVTTKVTGSVVTKGGKKKSIVLGGSSFTVRAGKQGKVAVKLNASGRKALRELKKVKVKVVVNVKRGTTTAKRTFTVTLKAPKPKRRKR